eukprot:scaffold22565_cov97-Cylindrotheca_fusiformis.AAC.7
MSQNSHHKRGKYDYYNPFLKGSTDTACSGEHGDDNNDERNYFNPLLEAAVEISQKPARRLRTTSVHASIISAPQVDTSPESSSRNRKQGHNSTSTARKQRSTTASTAVGNKRGSNGTSSKPKRTKTAYSAKAKMSSASHTTQLEKDDEPQVGDRVYSRFHNGDWYWGKVTNKFVKKRKLLYSIQYDDGDFIEEFDPTWGLATERHYKSAMIDKGSSSSCCSCHINEGSVDLDLPNGGNTSYENPWVVHLFYARRMRRLGRFPTKEDGKKYLDTLRQILMSFGITTEEMNAMNETQGRATIERAQYEAKTYPTGGGGGGQSK